MKPRFIPGPFSAGAACAAAALLMLFLSPPALYAWSLTDMLRGRVPSSDSGAFDPLTDIRYLPPLIESDSFAAVRDLSVCRRMAVRQHIHAYLTVGRRFTLRAIEGASLYHDLVREVFDTRGEVPPELAFLPLLESGYNPRAVSSSRAVGLWQFMSNTAKPLGLRQDQWHDERRNIRRSTEAALRHLKNLHATFGSWELALAAYNGGAGYVGRAIRQAGTRDFWELRRRGALRDETAEFVPRYLALLVIYRNQKLFGVDDELKLATLAPSTTVTLARPVRISDAARVAGIPQDLLHRLNPDLCAGITPPSLPSYDLRVPVDAAEKISEHLDELYVKQPPTPKSHRVQRGECLTVIARRYNRSVDGIARYNKLRDPSRLQPGSLILIPN